VLLAGCASGGPTIDAEPGDAAVETPAEAAVAPECAELSDAPYDPPAEAQPEPDATLTDATPEPDLDPLVGGDATAPAPPDPVSAAQAWAEAEVPEHFAGVWIDQDAGATVIGFTDDVDRYAAEVRDRFGAGWWVVGLEHSEEELRAVQDEVTAREMGGWQDEAGAGDVYGAGSGTGPLNRVTISIVDPDEDRLAELSEHYGADRICFEIEREPTADDAVPAPWEPSPDADLTPGSTSIEVLVNEVSCASGESAAGRIAEPEITTTDAEVIVTLAVIPRSGAQDCQGNPATPFTLELDEPLGDRALLDGSHAPPAAPDLDDPAR
jgi:hypothetical protein